VNACAAALLGILICEKKGLNTMAPNQETTSKVPAGDVPDAPRDVKIDRNAPAGSKNSLGAQSVRDGRPATDDSVVEAMDEVDPGVPPAAPEQNRS
jgi:hypothetical protein